MAKVGRIITFRDLSEGIVQPVDEKIVVQNSVYLAVNLFFHKVLGRAVLREGITKLGSQIITGKTCLGLHQFIKSDGTTKIPLAVFNVSDDSSSTCYKYSGGSWSSSLTGLTASKKCRFLTYLDTVLLVNGTDKYASQDCSTWNTTGTPLDVGNMPNFHLVIEWRDKVYGVESANPNRLHFSDVQTGGSISWTSSGAGYIDVEPEGKQGIITGLAKVPGYLLIFKERALKRFSGTSLPPDDLISAGCLSQEAIVQTRQEVYFFNPKGIYLTKGGLPVRISKRVQDIIDAISPSFYSSVCGWGDNENVYFSIGDITLDDITFSNCVLVYNIENKHWTLLSFLYQFRQFSFYIDSNGKENIIAGDTDGNIWQLFEGETDEGKEIEYLLWTRPLEFGSRGLKKEISNPVFFAKNIKNGQVFCRIDEKGNFESIGIIQEEVQKIIKELKGRYFEFRIQGRGKGDLHIIGIDFPNINITTNYD